MHGCYRIYVVVTRRLLCTPHNRADVATLWQTLRGLCGNYGGLHDCYGIYVVVTRSLPCTPHNSHVHPIITTRTHNCHKIATTMVILDQYCDCERSFEPVNQALNLFLQWQSYLDYNNVNDHIQNRTLIMTLKQCAVLEIVKINKFSSGLCL